MQCPKCGAEAPDGARFCPDCGKRLPKPKPPEPEVAEHPVIREVDPILTPKEAAQLLKITTWKLGELRVQDKLPAGSWFEIPSAGSGRKKIIRYCAKVLLAWADAQEEPLTTAG